MWYRKFSVGQAPSRPLGGISSWILRRTNVPMIDLERTEANNDSDRAIPVGTVLTTALKLGLTVASIDILVTMSVKAPAWAAIEEMLAPFAATAVLVSVGFCTLWFVLVRPWLRLLSFSAFPVFVAISSFVGIALALFLVAGLVHPRLLLPPSVFRSVPLFVLCCGLAMLIYRWPRVQPFPSQSVQLAGKLVVALTLILTISVAFRWASTYPPTPGSFLSNTWGGYFIWLRSARRSGFRFGSPPRRCS